MHAPLPYCASRALAATAIALALSACTTEPQSAADIAELGNMDYEHGMPKSSPRQLVSTFESACLDGARDLASAEPALRSAGFVPLARRPGRPVVFVSDDKRPAVAISRNGQFCVVAAEARTGQTAAINALVAKRFPQAAAVSPQSLDRTVEQAWQVADGILFTSRSGAASYHSQLMLGIWRTP